ncbi:MAG: hypothetical protein ACREOI_21385 [bacterium]
MAIDIFMSVGKTSTPEQEKFVSTIQQHFVDNGLAPRAVGRTAFTSIQPLKFITELMTECSGTVIIAFERIHIQQGKERRGSDAEKSLQNVNLPTVWNQIEAAMAYVLGHPLLVIVEHGLRSEGLLETGYDWYVQWVNLDTATLTSRELAGVIADWKKRVESYHTSGKKSAVKTDKTIEPEKLTISQIIGSLKPAQFWTIGAAIIAAISAIATAAFQLGVHFAGKP